MPKTRAHTATRGHQQLVVCRTPCFFFCPQAKQGSEEARPARHQRFGSAQPKGSFAPRIGVMEHFYCILLHTSGSRAWNPMFSLGISRNFKASFKWTFLRGTFRIWKVRVSCAVFCPSAPIDTRLDRSPLQVRPMRVAIFLTCFKTGRSCRRWLRSLSTFPTKRCGPRVWRPSWYITGPKGHSTNRKFVLGITLGKGPVLLNVVANKIFRLEYASQFYLTLHLLGRSLQHGIVELVLSCVGRAPCCGQAFQVYLEARGLDGWGLLGWGHASPAHPKKATRFSAILPLS